MKKHVQKNLGIYLFALLQGISSGIITYKLHGVWFFVAYSLNLLTSLVVTVLLWQIDSSLKQTFNESNPNIWEGKKPTGERPPKK